MFEPLVTLRSMVIDTPCVMVIGPVIVIGPLGLAK